MPIRGNNYSKKKKKKKKKKKEKKKKERNIKKKKKKKKKKLTSKKIEDPSVIGIVLIRGAFGGKKMEQKPDGKKRRRFKV